MKTEISIRDYQPEDVQALANIYYNTIHRINIQHYTVLLYFLCSFGYFRILWY